LATLTYLKLFKGASQDELTNSKIEEEAKRCVVLAVKVPTVINFDEVLELDAIKYLKDKKKEVFDFMTLFTQTDAKDFSSKIETFNKLISEENLTLEEVLKKKQYV
jgi:hypothetical protein